MVVGKYVLWDRSSSRKDPPAGSHQMTLSSVWIPQQAASAGSDGINKCHWGEMFPQIICLGKAALDYLNKCGYPKVIYKQIHNETITAVNNKTFFFLQKEVQSRLLKGC